MRSEEGDNSRF